MTRDLKQTDALIFDLDGTLWDGVETYAQGFNDFFKTNNILRILTKDDIKGYMGWEEDKFLEATIPEFAYHERKKVYQEVIDFQYKRIKSDGGLIFDGVVEGLARLSEKYKLFIVSNCAEFTIEYFMKWAGIENLITNSIAHGQNYKPKHQNIQALIKKHELKNPVYVGDTDSDSRQSCLVPLPFVFVDYGFGKTDSYDIKFSSFTQLTEYFLDSCAVQNPSVKQRND
jgi:phosphoglycolate phosphatase